MTAADNGRMPDPSASSANVDDVAAPIDFAERARLPFPVVGIGASAGGLEALEGFFRAVPEASDMAFVVVQHLPPERESMMAEILARHTSMPVHLIQEGMTVEPNNVYVIRPGFTVTLRDGALRLGEPVEKRGHRRPVDDFFRSLAAEQKEKAIAVVLSGMGTNGTSGAQAIKAAGGLCLAQTPASAQFEGMPQSLIHAGYADQVLPPGEMPAILVQYARHPYLDPEGEGRARAKQAIDEARQHLNDVFAILRARTRHDFSGYKKPTLLRRIQRRMGLAGIVDVGEYAAHLRETPPEVQALANDLMINVTGFFRDPDAWEGLRTAAVRSLIAGAEAGEPLRVWVTACASGEEAYSVAMLLAEEADRAGWPLDAKIFATDTADRSLGFARAGVYPAGIEGDLSLERLDRFFDKDDHTYRIKKEIRDMVVFAPQDVLRDPPFSRVDLCTCRNLLIYLEPEMQQRVLTLMHFALRDGGYLFLGSAETLGTTPTPKLFEPVSSKWRIFRRIGAAQHRFADLGELAKRPLPDLRAALPEFRENRPSTHLVLQQALLEQFGPPTVVVDQHDAVVYFHGATSPYLVQPPGEPTRNVFELLPVPLRSAVRGALRSAAAEGHAVTVFDTRPGFGPTRVTAAPLLRKSGFFRVSFEPGEGETAAGSAPSAPALATEGSEFEDELRVLRRELRDTVEAFESSNEELKASNEEVVSINEELQSANEELETSKEELQSLNEELVTINGQLQSKLTELEAANNDLSNLLSSTSVAVLFLDTEFCVRRFTPAMHDLLELLPADIGRPVAHLARKFDGGDLLADARSVLATLAPAESEIRSHSGAWYLQRVLPYRTGENRIAGVVATFINISERKHAEQAVAAAHDRLQAVIEQMPAAVIVVAAPSGELLFGNRQLASLFGHRYPLAFAGTQWSTAAMPFKAFHANGRLYDPGEWPLARTLASGEAIAEEEIDLQRADGTAGTLAVSSAPVRNPAGEMVAVVAAF
jgi:two-component system CheB/CheR fusion protein